MCEWVVSSSSILGTTRSSPSSRGVDPAPRPADELLLLLLDDADGALLQDDDDADGALLEVLDNIGPPIVVLSFPDGFIDFES